MEQQLAWGLKEHPDAVQTFAQLANVDPRAEKAVRRMRRIRNDAIAAERCYLDSGYATYPTRNTAVEHMHNTWNYFQAGTTGEIALIHYTLVFIECGRRDLLDCPCPRCVAEQARLTTFSHNDRPIAKVSTSTTASRKRSKPTRSRL